MILFLIVAAVFAASVVAAIQRQWAMATWFILVAIFLNYFLPAVEAAFK